MQTLEQLLTARTAAEYRAQLLAALAGVGYVSKTGSGTGSCTSSGAATNAYSVRVRITTAGNLGSAAMQVSTDGGSTWSAAVAVPSSGTYVVGSTGLTLLFEDGEVGSTGNSFEVGDTYAAELVVPTFPITSWQPGSAPLTIVEKDAEANEQRDAVISALAAGGYLLTATGDWLTLLAAQVYKVDRQLARAAVGNVVLHNSTGSSIPITANQHWVGNGVLGIRYNTLTAGSVPAGGDLTVQVRAELTGDAHNVGANSITTFFTSAPGLTVNNPDAAWITSMGAANESDASLQARCQARWPSLSDSAGTDLVYEGWALAADPSVSRVFIRASATVAGQVEVFVAGPSGPVGAPAVAAVQAYMEPLVPYPSTVLVDTATAHPVTITGTIYARAGQGTLALAEATANLNRLGREVAVGGVLYRSNVYEEMEAPEGVRNVLLGVLPGANSDGDVELADLEVVSLTLVLNVVEV